MNITVSVLGRSAVDQPFTQLVAPSTLVMSGDSLGYTPSVPGGVLELRLRVQSADQVLVAAGLWLDPAHPSQPTPVFDGNGVPIRIDPPAASVVRATYGAWGGQIRDVPFGARESFLFTRPGTASA